MENRLKRIEVAIIVLLVLAVINIAQPFIAKISSNGSESSNQIELKELPSDVSKDILNKIVYKVKTDFNRSNWEGLFNVFGDYAKSQTTVEEIEQTFNKLKSATGNIGTYAYSHYEYEGEGNGADWFQVQYKCRFDNGKGTIKISTRTVDDVTEVVGIKINLEEL